MGLVMITLLGLSFVEEGEVKADGVILPRDAMNFSIRPLGRRPAAPEFCDARFVVERLFVRRAEPLKPLDNPFE
jgi:hypothetical protein